MPCYDEGSLRAYLDDTLPSDERLLVDAHLDGCPACRSCLADQRTLAAQVGALMAAPAPVPDPHAALSRLRSSIAGERGIALTPAAARHPLSRLRERGAGGEGEMATLTTSDPLVSSISRRNSMSRLARLWSSPRRPLFAGLAVLVVLLCLLALPPVRAAADQLLGVFRVQKVLFVPTSADRLKQLQNLNFDGKSLFVAQPKLVNKPAQPRTVNSAGEVFGAVGFAFHQPANLPSAPTSTKFVIRDRSVFQFQVDVNSARQLLALLDVNDVTLPDALGAKPISADVPPSVESHYQGKGYDLTLYQGRSPTITLPEGVNLAQLGKAALRLLGMDPRQADELSKEVDWGSTLIFPFPTDVTDLQVEQVSVGRAQGLLVGNENGRRSQWQLYWQDGDRFYMLEGHGDLTGEEMIATAESVR